MVREIIWNIFFVGLKSKNNILGNNEGGPKAGD